MFSYSIQNTSKLTCFCVKNMENFFLINLVNQRLKLEFCQHFQYLQIIMYPENHKMFSTYTYLRFENVIKDCQDFSKNYPPIQIKNELQKLQ